MQSVHQRCFSINGSSNIWLPYTNDYLLNNQLLENCEFNQHYIVALKYNLCPTILYVSQIFLKAKIY